MSYKNNLQEIEQVVDDFAKVSGYVASEYGEKLIQQQKDFIKQMLESGNISVEDIKKTIRNNAKNYEENKIHYVAKRIEKEVKEKNIPKYLVAVNGIKNDLTDIVRISRDPDIISQKIRSSIKIYTQACEYTKVY